MRCSTVTEADPKLAALLTAAQQEPVLVEQNDRPVAVVMSVEQYERLSDRASRDFHELCDQLSQYASDKGLTETKLSELLNSAE